MNNKSFPVKEIIVLIVVFGILIFKGVDMALAQIYFIFPGAVKTVSIHNLSDQQDFYNNKWIRLSGEFYPDRFDSRTKGFLVPDSTEFLPLGDEDFREVARKKVLLKKKNPYKYKNFPDTYIRIFVAELGRGIPMLDTADFIAIPPGDPVEIIGKFSKEGYFGIDGKPAITVVKVIGPQHYVHTVRLVLNIFVFTALIVGGILLAAITSLKWNTSNTQSS